MKALLLRSALLVTVFSQQLGGQPGKAIRGLLNLSSSGCETAEGTQVLAVANPDIRYDAKILKGKFAILGPRVLNPGEVYTISISGEEYKFKEKVKGTAVMNKETEASPKPCPVSLNGGANPATPPTKWERGVPGKVEGEETSKPTVPGDFQFKVELVRPGEQISRSVARWRNQAALSITRVDGERLIPVERLVANGSGVVRLDKGKYSGASLESTYQLAFERPGYQSEVIRVKGLEGLLAAKATLARQSRWQEDGLLFSAYEDGSRGRYASAYEIEQLPIGGRRSADFLALLNPGVVPAPMAGTGYGPGFGPSIGSAGEVAVNGIRPRMNNFVTDGADNNDEAVGVRRQGFVFGGGYVLEAVREFQSATGLYDARYGRASGGQFNLLTLVGTSVLKGKVYSYWGDSRISARDAFNGDYSGGTAASSYYRDGVLTEERYNRGGKDRRTNPAAGFVLSSPVSKNSFASLNAEWRQARAKQTRHFAVPTVAERGFNGSGETGLPAYGNGGITNPNSAPGDAVFSLFPFANNLAGPYGVNTFTQLMPADEKGLLYSLKLDHTFRSRRAQHHLASAYSGTTESSTLPVTGGALYSTLSPNVGSHSGTVFFDSNFGAIAANAFRIAVGQANFTFGRKQDPLLKSAEDPFLLNQVLLINQTNSNAAGYDGRASYFTQAGVNTDSLTGLVGEIRVAGFSGLGADVFRFPQARRDRTIQIADSFTRIVGDWTLVGGIEFWNYRFKNALNPNSRPYLQFNGQSNPKALVGELKLASGADLVAYGLPAFAMRTLTTRTDDDLTLRRNQADTFFQANGRLGTNFTVSLGLRVAFHQLPSSEDGRFEASFDQAAYDLEYERLERSCLTNIKVIHICRARIEHLRGALLGQYDRVFSASRATFDPRVGFAWTVGPSGKTVIRGGWGRYTSQFQAAILDESRSNLPASYPLNFANANPYIIQRDFTIPPSIDIVGARAQASIPTRTAPLSNLIPSEAFEGPVSYLQKTFNGWSLVNTRPVANLLNARAQHLAITVEQRINRNATLSLSYVSTGGRNLLRRLASENEGEAFGTPGASYNELRGPSTSQKTKGLWIAGIKGQSNVEPIASLPFGEYVFKPRIANLKIDTGGSSSYRSLQGEFRGRLRNAQVGSAFTWGHSIDDASDFFDTRSGYAYPRDSKKTRSNRASSDFDARLRSVTSFDWRPTGNGRLWKSWSLGGIYTLQHGMPFSVNSIYDSNPDGLQNDGISSPEGLLAGGGDRRVPLQLASGARVEQFIPTEGIGTVGRNAFRGAGINVLDLSLGRTFAIGDRQLNIRMEGFNVFNRTNYGLPVRLLGAAGFGSSFDTAINNRRLQLHVQFHF